MWETHADLINFSVETLILSTTDSLVLVLTFGFWDYFDAYVLDIFTKK